jgi:hypothetical protein
MANSDNTASRLLGFHDIEAAREGIRQGFFQQQMTAAPEELDRRRRMLVVEGGNDRGIAIQRTLK